MVWSTKVVIAKAIFFLITGIIVATIETHLVCDKPCTLFQVYHSPNFISAGCLAISAIFLLNANSISVLWSLWSIMLLTGQGIVIYVCGRQNILDM